MKLENIKRINNQIEVYNLKPFKNYKILYIQEGITVIREEDNYNYIYILGVKIYQEKVRLHPLFSIEEIKTALTFRINNKKKGGI